MSVAIHPHHCVVNLICIAGTVTNLEFAVGANKPRNSFQASKFDYVSPIENEKGGYFSHATDANGERLSDVSMIPLKMTELKLGDSIKLSPRDLHTVFVPKGETAAWIVREGQEDPFYDPVCYSIAPLERFSFRGMYRPMSSETLDAIIAYLEESEPSPADNTPQHYHS